ncbi:MFS transporter [Atopobacter sp. AH10]|uniref:MFS transporter n=1 Tax=Atopobacter sp. AH10 TaxID=2315861 RepID=UPI000EF1DFC4|nr:MFS transporter [Atopobacter sp. AH10]RLK63499.1 MFS transporter [Atopobacter sp. AH10]
MENKAIQLSKKDKSKLKRQAFITYSIYALIYVFVAFHRNSPGVLKDPIQATFGASIQDFALITGFFFYPYLLMQLPAGILTDKLGPKKIMFISSLVTGLGSFLFSIAPNMMMMYLARALVGLGVSTVFVSLVKVQHTWFSSKQQGLMMGVTGIAANLGALMAQAPLVLLSKTFGWRMTFATLALGSLLLAALSLFFAKEKPSDIGLPSMAEIEGRIVQKPTIHIGEALKSVLSNKNTWLAALSFLGLYTSYIVLFGAFGAAFIQEAYGLELELASSYLMLATLGALLAGLVVGGLSDKWKRRKWPLIGLSLATLAVWVIFVFVKLPLPLLLIVLFLLGFTMSGFSLCWPIANETNDPRYAGISSATVNTIGYMGSAFVPQMMAKIIHQTPSYIGYQRAFLVLIGLIAFGCIVTFLIPETKARNIYHGEE